MKNLYIILISLLLVSSSTQAQVRFSFSTDFGFQHNFRQGQKFWAFGPTMQTIFHLNPRDGVYGSFGFFSNGRFTNIHVATAKNNTTIPNQIIYKNTARMGLQEISLGWRRYIKGTHDATKKINIYCTAGLGLIFGSITNKFTVSPDTSLYYVPIYEGKASFKRLSADFGAGVEKHLSADVFVFSDLRVWIPTSSYPNRYIFVNDTAPFIGLICVGFRILF